MEKQKLTTLEKDTESIKEEIISLSGNIDKLKEYNSCNGVLEGEVIDSIKDIKRRIRKNRLRYFGSLCIRNLKISGRVLQLVCPYVIVVGMSFGVPCLLGDIPFYRQLAYQPKTYHITCDTLGRENVESEYKEYYPNYYSFMKATSYTAWEKKVDGKYYRTITNYNSIKVSNLSSDQLIRLFNGSSKLDALKLDDFLKTQDSYVKHETKDTVTEEELNEKEYTEISFSLKDEKDVLLVAQSASADIILSIIYILVACILCYGIYSIEKDTGIKFHKTIKSIMESHPNIDFKKLKQLFDEQKIRVKVIPHKNNNHDCSIETPVRISRNVTIDNELLGDIKSIEKELKKGL